MYTVNAILKSSPIALTFVFKAYKAADDLYRKMQQCTSPKIEVADDYGMTASIDMASIAAISFSEYCADMDKNGEMQIIQAKSSLKTQNMAKNDAGLRLLNTAVNSGNGSPGVVQ